MFIINLTVFYRFGSTITVLFSVLTVYCGVPWFADMFYLQNVDYEFPYFHKDAFVHF